MVSIEDQEAIIIILIYFSGSFVFVPCRHAIAGSDKTQRNTQRLALLRPRKCCKLFAKNLQKTCKKLAKNLQKTCKKSRKKLAKYSQKTCKIFAKHCPQQSEKVLLPAMRKKQSPDPTKKDASKEEFGRRALAGGNMQDSFVMSTDTFGKF